MTHLKQWVIDEAAARGVSPGTVYRDVKRGAYRGLRLKRVNMRVVFVLSKGEMDSAVVVKPKPTHRRYHSSGQRARRVRPSPPPLHQSRMEQMYADDYSPIHGDGLERLNAICGGNDVHG